ncbi:hypothetical protein SAMN02745857_03836 [Andreprevotia lacus DSM 23236]|jgi:hypothetical protein|uniref:Uncharacterized protein n=1 Tax=Andreprevotia lacus DSM 23236 TaxID=1121001 RepID=A0A1W1Y103_9NEIS|nr:hypothetical protein SAMN02745857_03836 [Andreprevotia lacus DSM 23236]
MKIVRNVCQERTDGGFQGSTEGIAGWFERDQRGCIVAKAREDAMGLLDLREIMQAEPRHPQCKVQLAT